MLANMRRIRSAVRMLISALSPRTSCEMPMTYWRRTLAVRASFAVLAALAVVAAPCLADSWGTAVHRGANVGLWLAAADLKVLRAWGADHVRAQLLAKNMPVEDRDGRCTFTDEAWKRLEAFLAGAREAGLKVVLDLHQQGAFFPAENWKAEAQGAWDDPASRGRLASLWRSLAERFAADRDLVLGYDLLNEPVPPYTEAGSQSWNEVAAAAVKAIREVDAFHTVIVECASYANPAGMAKLNPVADANVVYSFHMYQPHEFTEQGTRPQWPFGQQYPGEVALGWDAKTPTLVDRQWLEASLKPVAEFQQRTRARVWVGEFSARRDAPDGSACRYLRDVLELFEARGWSWAYHAFRESGLWDLERCSDGNCQERHATTDRLELLREHWSRRAPPVAGSRSAASGLVGQLTNLCRLV
ncbi:MAG: hypothetical protein AUJ96_33685 [Armatimonadetes bacterium CG2_30_66_41]|nr:MAG: hypothetical protein AUJ96_33685 [Armatimonadetes bacterium CG2_30_66_41]